MSLMPLRYHIFLVLLIKVHWKQANEDMGYFLTARMALEGAIQLARYGTESEKSGCAKGGVLTPATAFGLPLISRLEKAGFTFSVEQ